MPRVKRGVTANARRKRLLKHTKGFLWSRKSKFRAAKEATLHAWSFQFADRKKKKRDFRRKWHQLLQTDQQTSQRKYRTRSEDTLRSSRK